jgi:hypothetical protein
MDMSSAVGQVMTLFYVLPEPHPNELAMCYFRRLTTILAKGMIMNVFPSMILLFVVIVWPKVDSSK